MFKQTPPSKFLQLAEKPIEVLRSIYYLMKAFNIFLTQYHIPQTTLDEFLFTPSTTKLNTYYTSIDLSPIIILGLG